MYRYKVGMYGGSFDPLHIGHIHDIIRAAAMCEELYVMISWCEGRESASKELRYRWILNSTRHLPNVKIIMIEDKAVSKEEYNTDYYWEKGAQDIKDTIGKPIDAVFCGSDYLGTGRFESLYCPESEVVYFDGRRFRYPRQRSVSGRRRIGSIFQRCAGITTSERFWLSAVNPQENPHWLRILRWHITRILYGR